MELEHLEVYSIRGLKPHSPRRYRNRRRTACCHRERSSVVDNMQITVCKDCGEILAVMHLKEPGKPEQTTLKRVAVIHDKDFPLLEEEVAELSQRKVAFNTASRLGLPEENVYFVDWDNDGEIAPYLANSTIIDNSDELYAMGDDAVVHDAIIKAHKKGIPVQWLSRNSARSALEGADVYTYKPPDAMLSKDYETKDTTWARNLPDNFLDNLTLFWGRSKGKKLVDAPLDDILWVLFKGWPRGRMRLYYEEYLRRMTEKEWLEVHNTLNDYEKMAEDAFPETSFSTGGDALSRINDLIAKLEYWRDCAEEESGTKGGGELLQENGTEGLQRFDRDATKWNLGIMQTNEDAVYAHSAEAEYDPRDAVGQLDPRHRLPYPSKSRRKKQHTHKQYDS